MGGETAQKFFVPRPCALRHRALQITQPEGTTNHPGGNPRSRAGPGDRTCEGVRRRPLAAGTKVGVSSQERALDAERRRKGPPAADSADGDDGATRTARKAKVTGSGTQRHRVTGQGSRKAGRHRSPGPPDGPPQGGSAPEPRTERQGTREGSRQAGPTGPRDRATARSAGTQGHGIERQTSRKAGRHSDPTGPGRAPPQGGGRPGPGTRSAGHPQGQPARRVQAGPEGQDRVARPIWGTGTVTRPLPSPTWKGPRPMFGVPCARARERHAQPGGGVHHAGRNGSQSVTDLSPRRAATSARTQVSPGTLDPRVPQRGGNGPSGGARCPVRARERPLRSLL